MNKFFAPILFSIILLAGCRSSDSSGAEEVTVDTITQAGYDTLDMAKTIVNVPSLWKVEIKEDGQDEKLEKPADNELASLSNQQIIDALNESYPDIQLVLDKISEDTIYISIPQSRVLTEQIGSTGAFNHMATIVYNLTELKNVSYVHFNFKEGDHAVPGTYSREDFKRLR